ncbi:MAG: threonylcarbamoyl-AMP synthase [Nitriliruptor sp.]|nr:MAG: threonylcarbamoyl-AMP synthase [Nitriliruptor sp.]
MSELLDATAGADDERRAAAVARAAELLLAGEVVVLPTDTVYGIAADAFSTEATAALLTAKGRDRAIPLPVMIRTPQQLPGLAATVSSAADRLVAAFWPGPLTLVLHAQPRLTWDIGESDGTVAIRMPLDDATLEVIRAVGPLAMTAANAPGGDAPRSVEDARDQLGEQVAAYLDAGTRPEGATSTIVDLTREAPKVLREGAIPTELVLDVAEGRVDPGTAAAILAGDGTDDGQ